MVEMSGWALALLLFGTFSVGMVFGLIVCAVCVAAGNADRAMNERHWMEQGETPPLEWTAQHLAAQAHEFAVSALYARRWAAAWKASAKLWRARATEAFGPPPGIVTDGLSSYWKAPEGYVLRVDEHGRRLVRDK